MPTNDIQRLIERYKAAIAGFNNKDESSHESRQELENLRWEELLPLVYRLRARAVLTGDFIIGCWRESEEYRLVAEQQASTEISALFRAAAQAGLKTVGLRRVDLRTSVRRLTTRLLNSRVATAPVVPHDGMSSLTVWNSLLALEVQLRSLRQSNQATSLPLAWVALEVELWTIRLRREARSLLLALVALEA